MDDKHHSAKDVPVATNVGTSTSSTPTTATAVGLYARRSCPRCGCRVSSLQFDKHTYPISTLPEHLHSTLLSHAKTT